MLEWKKYKRGPWVATYRGFDIRIQRIRNLPEAYDCCISRDGKFLGSWPSSIVDGKRNLAFSKQQLIDYVDSNFADLEVISHAR